VGVGRLTAPGPARCHIGPVMTGLVSHRAGPGLPPGVRLDDLPVCTARPA